MNLVLSRDGRFAPRGAVACETFDEAVRIAREQAAEDRVEEVCVIGGAALFALALPRATRAYLTQVHGEPEGDLILPPLVEGDWLEVGREEVPAGPEDDYRTTFRVLERRAPRA